MWTICTFAQIHGTVVDSETGDPIPYLNIYYDGKGMGTITDMEGRYSIEYHSGWNELTFSMVGYTTQVIKVSAQTRELNIKMRSDLMLEEVIVKPKKEKYSRKNNPAVELMKKVIASKKKTNLEQNDFYRYNKYQKITLAVNNITADSLRESWLFKKYPFFRDQVEVCDVTNKNILPLSIDETVSEKVYRKEPHSEKTYIRGINSGGVNELFSTGDMLTTVLKDVFQDIDIYQDRFRFLQYPFDSPVSEAGINFYKFYIMDTVYVDKEKCFHLSFVPNNPQDFGFTGHLYILADSTYRVKESQLNLPKKTDINFVDNMIIDQKFGELPTGEWVLLEDDMLCELSYLKKVLGSYQVRRTTRYFDFSFDPIPESMFKRKEKEIKDVNAMMRNEMYWSQYRQEELTKSETRMGSFVDDLTKIKGFKYIIFVLKALIENFVETSTPDSKVDIGPINTIISSNYIDGLRLRGSLQTTAKLHPHLFLKGYYAYGFKDQKSKYMGEVEYSFNKKEYLPREYPKNSLTLTYQYDNMLPSDKFISTDKDNVFTALKVCSVDQYNYERKATLKYEREREFGLKTTAMFRHANYEPCGELFYRTMAGESALQSALDRQELAGQKWVKSPFNTHDITVTEMSFGLRYAPGETFVNTKQRRLPVNLDAPEFTLQHTLALKGVLGGDYTYNMTEASAYKRFWLSSWGNIDVYLKGGIQWNKVPFPLLIMPAANLSYIIQDETFNLINNMEFLNDRYASLDVSWNMQGKLFNRIPLLKKLKWREFIGVKCLWGTLTDKNNPFLEQNRYDNTLMMFPGHYDMNGVYQYSSNVMDPKKPYVEITAGIHNIFKLLHVEYVRRLNYNELPTANKWGVRLMIRTVF
ncbi:MAG: DUF5686 and carboxypeptidase regulatory-like domain-containing protein [Bacteroides sp.]|nr:DUF5686 family protein [Phocaeicola faecicola]MCI5743402.1 DUF5686 and carboxypeptidase regulatory-like domain-containing protein [Bacteroides sp.]MDY4872515.1 DUF5686 family protein [Phocaeicola faecicola]